MEEKEIEKEKEKEKEHIMNLNKIKDEMNEMRSKIFFRIKVDSALKLNKRINSFISYSFPNPECLGTDTFKSLTI